MKKVFVSIVDGFHYRYLITSGVINSFVQHSGCQVDFIAPQMLSDDIKEFFPNSKVFFLEDFDFSLSFFNKLYLSYKRESGHELSKTLNIKNEMRKRKPFLSLSIFKIFALSFFRRELLFLKSYQHLILSTPGQKIPDIFLIFMAKIAKVKVISPVYSWDNLTAKGAFPFEPSKLLVWNNIMIEEAVKYQSMSYSNVIATGVPIYEEYKSVEKDAMTGYEFKKSIGFSSPELPLVTLTTIPRIYYGDGHKEIIKILKNSDFIKSKRINLLIRPHPMDDTEYDYLCDGKQIILDQYGTQPDSTLKKWKPTSNNIEHLAKTMKFSRVVLNLASTITIDASWFDTQVINIAIDFDFSKPSIKRFYQYTHYQHVVNFGAVNFCDNSDDLLDKIELCLSTDGDGLSENRKKLIECMCMGKNYDSLKATAEELSFND